MSSEKVDVVAVGRRALAIALSEMPGHTGIEIGGMAIRRGQTEAVETIWARPLHDGMLEFRVVLQDGEVLDYLWHGPYLIRWAEVDDAE